MTGVTIHGEGVLGKSVPGDVPHGIDTFDLPIGVHRVEYESDEMTSVCPITGQPDWYTCKITLSDSKRGVESKSLKLYLQSYRNEGSFCEMLADSVAQDIREATGAGHVGVTLTQKPRGGITITAHAAAWASREPRSRCDDGESDPE